MVEIVVVGCGGMAGTWVDYGLSRDDTEIVGLIDVNIGAARKMAKRHNLSIPVFDRLEEALAECEGDLVFNVTPPDIHQQVVTTALKAGYDVFGEKPMASSLNECREMVRVAEETGRMYAVMQNRRYNKNIRAYRQLITSGTIGEPGFITADFFLGPHFGGFRDVMEDPLILDMAIHTFDQARMIADADPVSVYCHQFNPPGSWYQGNAAAICIFEFSNGSVFSYNGSWCAEGVPTSWEASWRVSGSRGTAVWDGKNKPYAEVLIPASEKKFMNDFKKVEGEYLWNGREGHQGCLDEMFAALENGRRAETDCRDNIKSMAMVFGALESAGKEKKIGFEKI
ncbi:MAG: Gfo/Idh/MocA family protein [Halanaerobiales bacterium]